jgi:hypothetical protein
VDLQLLDQEEEAKLSIQLIFTTIHFYTKRNYNTMQKILTALFIFVTIKTQAQIPEDAVKYSWLTFNGTARANAIGGAIGSLGGDISANFVNPAGIGFYKTNEWVLGQNFNAANIKTTYRGFDNKGKKNSTTFGTSGIVFGMKDVDIDNENTVTKAMSIAFTQKANFNNNVYYKGLNNYSSYSSQFAEEFVNSRLSIDAALNTKSSVPFTVAPALYTYLIDTVRVNGVLKVKAAPEYILAAGQALQQEFTKQTSGGMYELAGTYAINDGKKWLGGITIGIPIVNFKSNTTVTESDTSKRNNNYFNSFTFNDNYTTKGIGFNVKVGIIYRPVEYIRLGLAYHTSSAMTLTDERETNLKTSVENPVGTFEVNSKTFNNNSKGTASYIQKSPWKLIASGSYVFREVEDVTKQRGFIAADVEYINHGRSKFNSKDEKPSIEDEAYYKQLNGIIKDMYKPTINAKIGGEVKFNTVMARLGFGYYGNPYKDAPVSANKMVYSAGLGYRNKGYFFDVTYAYQIAKDFDVPYRLQNAETVYANTKGNVGAISVTVGVKM